jgi:ethanolamine transporter EutH
MTKPVERTQMMGPWLTTGLVIGTMVGSGIFMLPVSLAPLGTCSNRWMKRLGRTCSG